MTTSDRRRTLAYTVAAVVAAALTWRFAQRPGDFAGYVLVGELGLNGGDIYRDAPPHTSTWPPLFALLCIPIAALARVSLVGTRVLWLLVNWAVLALALGTVVRLVYDRALTTAGPRSTTDGVDLASGSVLLPLLLCWRWALSNFEHLQVNIPIFALTVAGLLLHRRGRDASAGLLIGAAAALKVMPILFAPYFAWRRQWRAAAFTALAAIAWSLIPAAVYGWSAYVDQLRGWQETVRVGWTVGKMNISVFAMLDRIVGHHLVPFTVPGFNELTSSGSPAVALASAGSLAIVAALGLWLFRGPYDAAGRTTMAEWSTVLLVASLFGTVAWKAYLVVLLLPMALFVATWRDATVEPAFRRRLRALTWLAFALGMMANDDLVGQRLAWRLEMGSLLSVMALLVLGTLFWYRHRVSSSDAEVRL